MILEAGYEGFAMFELGKVGIFIAIVGVIYLFAFSSRLLPDVRTDAVKLDEEPEEHGDLHRVEAVLGARFPVSTRNWVILISNGIMGPK